MTIGKGRSDRQRASVRCLILASTLLALACGGNDVGPTTPPGPTSEGKSGSATITATAPVFTSVSITPAASTVYVGRTTQLTATAVDQNGAPMAGATFTYRSADLTIARVSSTGLVTGVAPGGPIHIYVTGTIRAVTKSASVLVTVVAASRTVRATTGNVFTPQTVSIPVGGKVMWTFQALHNVTFAGSGGSTRIVVPPPNIPNTSSGSVSRTFPTPGQYMYRCSIHPSMSGIVYVR